MDTEFLAPTLQRLAENCVALTGDPTCWKAQHLLAKQRRGQLRQPRPHNRRFAPLSKDNATMLWSVLSEQLAA